ncbi:hypothetical protein NLG97_g9267 [Lecanicillium saksenae]|uniref:Uncharacterized protein n=1 Tax=Lecanicillium saksenae TaxID=468837 RepID=A0ACC1QHS7_9HYPO|nr:hypothetical protein NLG97_g9267 [Lecanicillium saksenae]
MPSPADLTLRDAVVADLGAIAQIVASGPDAAANWTYPDWRDRVEETKPLHLRAFARVFAGRKNLVRVAQRGDGRVVGYCTWVKREKAGDEVTTVDMREAYDEKGV